MTLVYATPLAFKQALEQRLRNQVAGDGEALNRRRQLLIFDRFLARVISVFADAVVLKGGLVLELRLERARTTKDIDLRLVGDPNATLSSLQEAARLDLHDFLGFEVTPDKDHPDITNDGMQYRGLRFRAVCHLGGKPFGSSFGVDVAFADPMLGEPDVILADDVLDFAGIAPPTLRLYPIETHIAEKLHAYTLPRKRMNSRVKDLPDLALLASAGELNADRVRRAIQQTFEHRKTHPAPTSLLAPPAAWAEPYKTIAEQDGLPWKDLDAVTLAARAFLDPLLAGSSWTTWSASTWTWGT
ncbi:MAG: nucleotidyl transferase AbiEii/AbiGii toxin family protein [Deltaproteobacteria bacterium]|nr:nucleotidyl transferase AbiEii/AbiGii toxin family protein [Deltaproteobacteria bacterium]